MLKNLKLPFICIVLAYSLFACAQKEEYHKASFEFIKEQIILKAVINGKGNHHFLLDTGVDPSVIDHQTAIDLHLPIATEGGSASGRGDDKVQVFPTKMKVNLGMDSGDEIEALTLDMNALNKKLGRKVHGILGYSFLKDKRLVIDYQNNTVTFCKNEKAFQNQFKNQIIKTNFFYDREDRIPLIDYFIINDKKFIASIDTGSSLNIQVYHHRLADVGLDYLDLTNTKVSEISGAQGKKKIFDTTLKNITVANAIQFEDERLTVSEIKNTEQLRMGNIGNEFLQNFKVGFDYFNNGFILEKYPD